MGTNFYTKEKTCPTCGNTPEAIHLGKSSAGWQFSFQYNGGRFYKNVHEMREWLKDKTIQNEYGRDISHDEFWGIVEAKQTPENENHAKNYPSDSELVIDGYSFSDTTFS